MVRYYIRTLESAGLLRTKRVGLNEPNRYEFVWHSLFEQGNCMISQERQCISGPERQDSAGQERQSVAVPFKEEVNHSRESDEEENRSIERLASAIANPNRGERSAPVPLPMWEASQVDAMRRAVGAFRWQEGGERVKPSDELLARLLTAGRAYSRTPYQVAALLHRKETEIRNKRRLWPQKPAWFLAVVDTAYGSDSDSFIAKDACRRRRRSIRRTPRSRRSCRRC